MGTDLADNHTSIINIGGRYFDHFLKLFDTDKSDFAISKRVACITDLDPVRKTVEDTDSKKTWKSCAPIFLDVEEGKYEYKPCSNNTVDAYVFSEDDLIRVFSQEKGKSSTFEYDLLLQNTTCELLITKSVSNAEKLKKLMKLYKEEKPLEEMVKELGENDFSREVRLLPLKQKSYRMTKQQSKVLSQVVI